MKKKKSPKIKLAKETTEERKKRVASGQHFRSAVFDDKKRKLLDKMYKSDERDY